MNNTETKKTSIKYSDAIRAGYEVIFLQEYGLKPFKCLPNGEAVFTIEDINEATRRFKIEMGDL